MKKGSQAQQEKKPNYKKLRPAITLENGELIECVYNEGFNRYFSYDYFGLFKGKLTEGIK